MKKHYWMVISATAFVICLGATSSGIAAEVTISSLPSGHDAIGVDEATTRNLTRDDTTLASRVRTALSLSAETQAASDIGLWFVMGDGGGTGSSATYSLSYTTGQGSVGNGSGGLFELNRGFWQNFSTSCCVGKRGNVDMAGIVDVSDLCKLVSFLSGGEIVLACVEEGNVSGSGIVDLVDLSALIDFLTGGSYVLPNCP